MVKHESRYTVSAIVITLFAIALIAGGFIARFAYLRQIPFAFYHDEIDHVFTGEAVARFGSNISGDWSPWQLIPGLTRNVTAELPSVFHAAAQRMFGYGPQSGHIPSAVFGIAAVLATSYISWLIWRSKPVAFWSGLVVFVTPWSVHLSRMGYEAPISLFFQLVLVVALVQIMFKKLTVRQACVWIVVAAASILLAFYTYHGAKITVPVLVFGHLLYSIVTKKPRMAIGFIALLTICSAALVWRTSLLINAGAFRERNTEFILSSGYLGPLTDKERLDSLELPGTSLVVNKGTLAMRELLNRYVSVFDIRRLAISGYEAGFQFSLVVSGFFSVSVVVLTIYGIAKGLRAAPAKTHYLLFLILISPVASAVSEGYQSIFRSALTYVLLLMMAGYGISTLVRKNRTAAVVFLAVLCVELGMFTHNYLNRYGVISADNHYFDMELLAGYLDKVEGDRPVLVVGEDAFTMARSYVAYTGIMPDLNWTGIHELGDPSLHEYHVGHVTFIDECTVSDFSDTERSFVISAASMRKCLFPYYFPNSFSNPVSSYTLPAISSQVGSGTYYYVVNDVVCSDIELPEFVRAQDIAAFDPVRLSAEEYCKTWVRLDRIVL